MSATSGPASAMITCRPGGSIWDTSPHLVSSPGLLADNVCLERHIATRCLWRSGALIAAAWWATGSLAACSQPQTQQVRISVDKPAALIDAPLAITVSGVAPGHQVTIRATSIDADKRPYESAASFTANSAGRLDLRTAAPVSGSYGAVDPMGLFWSLQPPPRPDKLEPAEFTFASAGQSMMVKLAVVVEGRSVAEENITRLYMANGVKERAIRPDTDGFYGEYFEPRPGTSRGSAVLLFGGSEGGLNNDREAALLASHGYAALDLAYFGEPGLPKTLSNIPLEYFAKALGWLSRQTGVDADRIAVSGVSRGSEAAFLLGVHYPQLVHGVIALVPSNVANCGLPNCDAPAWLLGGVPLPYTRVFGETDPPDQPAAVIPVESIQGSILMSCGGRDNVWASCAYSAAIQARLDRFHFGHSHALLDYANAGHEIADAMPYLPNYLNLLGGTASAEESARAKQWPHLLDFLSAA